MINGFTERTEQYRRTARPGEFGSNSEPMCHQFVDSIRDRSYRDRVTTRTGWLKPMHNWNCREFLKGAGQVVGASALPFAGAQGASWPSKPITAVIGYKAGGGTDFVGGTATSIIEPHLGGAPRCGRPSRPTCCTRQANPKPIRRISGSRRSTNSIISGHPRATSRHSEIKEGWAPA